MWVGYLFVHRVEALAECADAPAIDALALHLLRALAVDQTEDAPHEHGNGPLQSRLHLPWPALHQLMVGLQTQGLVRRCEPGCWCLSDRGRDLLGGRSEAPVSFRRLALPFVERLTPTGRRAAPPHFLPLAECPAHAWDVGEAHRFDLGRLDDAAGRPPEWKGRYGFPADVRRVLSGTAPAGTDPTWERVVVDRPERTFVVLLLTEAGQTLMGFAARADGWTLLAEAPVLHLPAGARDALPDLAATPDWAEAWRLWCRQRHLPLSEAEACRLSPDGPHLDVHAPDSLVQRLRQAKADPSREESGVLAGDGYLRPAAILRVLARG
jgi:hypothetical protein